MNLSSQPHKPDFHGAAIIDDSGREIPITEAMIQQACRKLEQQECNVIVPPFKPARKAGA